MFLRDVKPGQEFILRKHKYRKCTKKDLEGGCRYASNARPGSQLCLSMESGMRYVFVFGMFDKVELVEEED